MKLNSLHDVFVDSLRDLYNAEKQLIRALPKMAKAASSPELKLAMEEHLTVTENQAHRLEQIFEELEMSARGKQCPGMHGLIEEGTELIEEGKDSDPNALDAALITAAQKVEHYEISGYGSVRTFAETLGFTHIAELLQETLDEESHANELLTGLAETQINEMAMHGDDQEIEDRIPKSANGRSNSRTKKSNSNSRSRSSRSKR